VTLTVAAAIASSALIMPLSAAAECASTVTEVEQAIEQARATGSATAGELAQAETLLKVGKEDCAGGAEDAALKVLQEAKNILNI
jgi:fructoselysine-6-P-deglycase FrlB-like protein